MKADNQNKISYTITKEGSLGLLAYGDIGLREWRKVKRAFQLKQNRDKQNGKK